MSAQKKKTPLIAIVAAIFLLAAGGFAFFTQKTSDTVEGDKVASSVVEEQAGTDDSVKNTETTVVDAAEDTGIETKTETNTADTVPQPEMEAEGIKVEPGNPVVAKVDGKDITRTDVYRFIQTMPQNVQQLPAVTVYPIAMEQVVNTRIVQTKAEESKIEETPEFKREMEVVKQQITRNLYLQREVDTKITDKMVKNQYERYIKEIPAVEERNARHILLDSEDKAKAVLDKLNKGGKFTELATELSIGPTAPKGGDLGYFGKGEMVPEFSDAVFAMKKGDVLQKPVKTQFGWHVIQLVDVRERAKPTLEQMTPTIRAELSRTILDDLVKNWRKKAKIEQFDINGKPLKDGANVIGVVPAKPDAK